MNADDPVGYGRPPKATQFKKGKSGNPKGRPKGSRNLHTLMDEELQQRIQLSEGGKVRSLRKGEALVKSVVNKGIGGDIRAASKVLDIAAIQGSVAAVMQAPMTAEDWEAIAEFMDRVRSAPSVDAVIEALKETDA
ncbi:hypothetical protein EDC65_3285 [Stella humosa]|uniref:DUF5681 domain-containing protein n=1 Tax=Stella humosa TaxID=94 RepID=A0A3N1KQ72_9PROT|nr:DUF5681 domain-containing protein [Stella humosa]ROP83943.1 hypothetical protein EDC65_3285 [Stella humosa]BBK33450.1 hypothetical protein STHU_40840 [Stella humosa]